MAMNEKFKESAHRIVKNMYQIIADVNTTLILADRDGMVIDMWNSVLAKPEYVLEIQPGDVLSEKTFGRNAVFLSLKQRKFVEISEGMEAFGLSCPMFNLASPIQDAYDEIIGSLGVFCPAKEKKLDFIRGVLKITNEALEGQCKALELESDYNRVYNQLLGSMETIPLGTIVTDKKMTIIHVNDATTKIFGDSAQDIVGKKADEYLNTEKFFQGMIDEGRTMLDEEMTFRMPDGEVRCEVIVSLVKGEEHKSVQGLIIKLKNANYMFRYKKSKEMNQASFHFGDIVGPSEEMQEAIRLGKIAARSTSNVLISGESGTGKELFAQSIHNHSARREGPFVAINCGAMPGGLVESELFGYEGGAFTGARKEGQPGKFEQANGGTLFLDEIGDMPLSAQISLLRVLQNKEIVRVGGNRTIKINARVIAATNRDIEKEVMENRFRKDLYYRINVFSIVIPSLRERISDVLTLAEIFVKRYSVQLNKYITGIDSSAKEILMNHSWPGNVRELENVIERAVNISKNNVIEREDLPENLRNQVGPSASKERSAFMGTTRVEEMERQVILEGLKNCNGNISKTAEHIGMGRRSLYRRLEYYRINNKEYKQG